MSAWKDLDKIVSRGSCAGKAATLGEMHAHRKKTLSQFFTPAWLVRYIWGSISHAFQAQERYSLLDNSLGSASMLRMATPDQFSVSGFDIDKKLMSLVTDIFESYGFEKDICQAGMEEVELGQYSAALINPAFSIPLSSPHLKPYLGVTHYGKFGEDTSAVSQEYALAQALSHCDIVAAIVPHSVTKKLSEFGSVIDRLHAEIRLPRDTFISEDVTTVKCDLLIFGSKKVNPKDIIRKSIRSNSEPEPIADLQCRPICLLRDKPIRVGGIDESAPVISIGPTGDNRVIMNRAGRQIKLGFSCGATEAKVMNAIYRHRLKSVDGHRLPNETKYQGQFKLSLDAIILQNDPYKALDELTCMIKSAGGNPIITRDLKNGLKALIREHEKMIIPYGRTVYRKGSPKIAGIARKMSLLNRTERGAVVAANESVLAKRVDSGFLVETKRGTFTCDHDLFFNLFEVDVTVKNAGYWEEIQAPIAKHFPEEIAALTSRAKALGLDKWLSWDFQLEDLCELAFRPAGGICGWQMGLGKTRLALALATLLKGKSLIVVKSRLVNELEREMRELNLTDENFKIIRSITDTKDLKKLNIVSYETIKRPMAKLHPKLTVAKHLKGRITNVIADEGSLLANFHSQQTKAIWKLGTRKNYIFDGSLASEYPRQFIGLASWAAGEAKSYQPYSIGKGFMDKYLFEGVFNQKTGKQTFIDNFVVYDWATNQFNQDFTGAKREVPKIKQRNLQLFRSWLAPLVKRRVQQEPAVTKHVTFPVPDFKSPQVIEWDFEHLCLYIEVLERFSIWYKDYIAESQINEKAVNLTMVLARLEACFKAANCPSMIDGYAKPYNALTSKERAVVELVANEVKKGRKPVVFARNPTVLKRLGAELDKINIKHLIFTGEESIVKRTEKLNREVREGDTGVVLASFGVTQDGLNLHQLNTFIFYNRSYKQREEFQSIYRLLRPQQKDDVYGYFMHLAGSIDEYQAQLCDWKLTANEAGLDYGDQPEDDEFLHFDSMIHRFLESLPELKEKLELHKQSLAA